MMLSLLVVCTEAQAERAPVIVSKIHFGVNSILHNHKTKGTRIFTFILARECLHEKTGDKDGDLVCSKPNPSRSVINGS